MRLIPAVATTTTTPTATKVTTAATTTTIHFEAASGFAQQCEENVSESEREEKETKHCRLTKKIFCLPLFDYLFKFTNARNNK